MDTLSERKRFFEKLYMDNQQRLIAYTLRFVPDRAVALDLIHDSFLKYWDKYFTFDKAEARKILFVILRNTCLDYLKHLKITLGKGNTQVESITGEELLFNLDYYFKSSEDSYLLTELRNQVNTVLDTLPARCRQVFELSRFNNMKNREIAEHLGISETAVEKHIRRALKAFEDSLDNCPYSSLFSLVVLLWLTVGSIC